MTDSVCLVRHSEHVFRRACRLEYGACIEVAFRVWYGVCPMCDPEDRAVRSVACRIVLVALESVCAERYGAGGVRRCAHVESEVVCGVLRSDGACCTGTDEMLHKRGYGHAMAAAGYDCGRSARVYEGIGKDASNSPSDESMCE